MKSFLFTILVAGASIANAATVTTQFSIKCSSSEAYLQTEQGIFRSISASIQNVPVNDRQYVEFSFGVEAAGADPYTSGVYLIPVDWFYTEKPIVLPYNEEQSLHIVRTFAAGKLKEIKVYSTDPSAKPLVCPVQNL